MNKSKFINPAMALLLMLGYLFQIHAQTDKDLLAQLVAEDQDAINALVLYPEETRQSILEATLYPEALIKLESIQSQTSTAFQELIDNFPRNTQEMIWDLTRYPNLIHQLAQTARGNEKALSEVLKEYPDVIHQRARQASLDFHPQLVQIQHLNQAADVAFQSLLMTYEPNTQAALRELISLPEVLTILTDNIRLTVLVGDIYKKEPEWVLYKADSLNLDAARQNAEEIEDWKASLKDNPQALDDLKATAESYADEHGYYDDEYYDYNADDLYYDSEMEDVVIRQYYYYNYPYWFGYPSWYYYPRWRLYPMWYDWGFYINPGGTFVFVGLPSFNFTYWYFYYPNHHYYWPHLSAQFTNHYYGHRGIGTSSINTSVADWRNSNRDVISDDWMRDDGRLVERFQEYGKFESSRTKYNKDHPFNVRSQKEYLDKNTRRYPSLDGNAERNDMDRKISKDPIRTDTKRKESTAPRKKNEPTLKKPLPPDRTTPKVDKGRVYHKSTWDKAKTTRPNTRTVPKVKTKAPKTTVPKKRSKTTRKKN